MAGHARTFLVDSYVPGMDAASARGLFDGLGTTDDRLTWLCALAIPAEDTVTCVVSAWESQDVVDVLQRAGLCVDHVAEVVLLAP